MFLDLVIDAQERLLGFAICAVTIVAAILFMFRHLRRYRLIADTPTALIRSAPQGYVELKGHVISCESSSLNAPLSGRPCVWYRFHVDRYQRRGKSGNWSRVRRGQSDTRFMIDDGTGRCLIDPDGAEIHAAQRRIWYGNSPTPLQGSHSASAFAALLQGGQRYRYTEHLIMEHEPLYALGRFTTLGGGRNLPTLQALQGDVIRLWKLDYPALLQRFGTEGSRELTQEQWQAVQQAALEQARAQQESLRAAPEVHLLEDPQQRGRPLFLSTFNEDLLISRFRQRALLCLIGVIAAVWFCIELMLATVVN